MSLFSKVIQKLYKLAYQLQLVSNFFYEKKVRGAYVAVWFNDHILLIQNSYKKYKTLPCGGVKRSEGIAQAAARELWEEVGILSSPEMLELVSVMIRYEEHKEDTVYIFELFLNDKPKIEIDNREVVWASFVDKNTALAENLAPAVNVYLAERI